MKNYNFKIDDLWFRASYENTSLMELSFSEIDKEAGNTREINELISFLTLYFNGKDVKYSGKYILQGTDKEKQVLKECSNIPYGNTISYKELAEKSKFPKGSRFIGNVMAKNKLPIIIPCHRVIKSNGELGGYGGGKNIKKRLLILEGRI